MLIVLTLVYVALLFLLIKIGVLKPNTFWKISPLIVLVVLFLVFFLPMQWGAPSGPCQFLQNVVSIVPNVNGQVTEVHVTPWQHVAAGDPLFEIDKVPFEAAVDSLSAQLVLAQTRLDQSRRLLARQAGSEYEVQQYQSQVDALKGQIASAQWNLDSTVVEAPSDGVVMGVTVRSGQRVAASPGMGYLTLVQTSRALLVSINQNVLRDVEVGQAAEVVFKVLPGRVLNARVVSIASMNPTGQLASGTIPMAPDGSAQPFAVMLELEDDSVLPKQIGGGLTGTAAIYTESVKASHVIRRIMLRMEAWKNYVMA